MICYINYQRSLNNWLNHNKYSDFQKYNKRYNDLVSCFNCVFWLHVILIAFGYISGGFNCGFKLFLCFYLHRLGYGSVVLYLRAKYKQIN